MILQFLVTIRAYFGLFRDVSDMYLEVNTRYIEPGLALVDALSHTPEHTTQAEEELQAKKDKLSEFAKSAEDGILGLVKAVRRVDAPSVFQLARTH